MIWTDSRQLDRDNALRIHRFMDQGGHQLDEPDGYLVGGSLAGMVQSPRVRRVRAVESTFRFLQIRKRASQPGPRWALRGRRRRRLRLYSPAIA